MKNTKIMKPVVASLLGAGILFSGISSDVLPTSDTPAVAEAATKKTYVNYVNEYVDREKKDSSKANVSGAVYIGIKKVYVRNGLFYSTAKAKNPLSSVSASSLGLKDYGYTIKKGKLYRYGSPFSGGLTTAPTLKGKGQTSDGYIVNGGIITKHFYGA